MSMETTDKELLESDARTPRFTLNGLTVQAKCVSVYDGDTAQFTFRTAPNAQVRRFACRLCGYNSAEIIGAKDAAERSVGLSARDALRSLILGKIVTLNVFEFDKYGRPLVQVTIGAIDVCNWMITHGYGKTYNGRGKKEY